jgi:hypothetical protein
MVNDAALHDAPNAEVTAARLTSQRLSGPPAATPVEVVTRLLAVQAQDARGMRLSIRSRTAGVCAHDVDAALTSRRLLITWLNRGTLHLVTPEDYWWLHPLTTPQLVAGNARRLRQEGVSPRQCELGVATVVAAVASEGPQTRAQLRARLDGAGVPTKGQALIHVLLAASIQGHIVRGPMVGSETAYVSVPDWLGAAPEPLRAIGRGEALACLARRYLAGHGPADARDLARWAGLPLGEARLGLAALADEVVTVTGGLVQLAESGPAAGLPPPRLLGAFDPVLLGWVSRAAIVGRHRGIVTTNGIFRPFAMVAGRAVATWSLVGGTVELRPLEAIAAGAVEALETDAAAVLAFLGAAARPTRVLPAPG